MGPSIASAQVMPQKSSGTAYASRVRVVWGGGAVILVLGAAGGSHVRKQVAAGHVIFNACTDLIAFLLRLETIFEPLQRNLSFRRMP